MTGKAESSDGRIKKLAVCGISISLTLSIFAAGSLFTEQNSEKQARKLIFNSYKTQKKLEDILSSLRDAETGQRGYLVTGMQEFLEPYESGRSRIKQLTGGLELELADFSDASDKVAQMTDLINFKLSELSRAVAFRKNNQTEEALAVVKTKKGKQAMDKLRVLIADLEAREETKLQQELLQLQRTDNWLLVAFAGFFLLALGSNALFSSAIVMLLDQLTKKKATFEAIFDNSFSFIGLSSPDGKLLDCNQRALEFAGVTRDQVLGKYFWDGAWGQYSAETKMQIQEAVLRVAQGKAERLEIEVDGNRGQITVDLSLTPVRDEEGKIIYLVPEGRDITARKLLENQQRLLADTDGILARADVIDSALLTELLQAVCLLLDFQFAAIWRLDSASQKLRCHSLWHRQLETLPQFISTTEDLALSIGEGLPGRVWKNAAAEWLLEIKADDPSFMRGQAALDSNIHSGLALPFFADNTVVGVVEFFAKKYFTEEDLDIAAFLQVFASQIGQHLERKKAEQQKIESAETFKIVLENLAEGVYQLTKDGRATYWNPTAEKLLGYSAQEAQGALIHELIHYKTADGVFRPADKCPLLRVLENGASYSNFDDVFIHKDGSFVEVEYSSAPIFENEVIIGTVVAFRDISQRKDAERRVSEFYATVSHELRTPLTSIRGSLGVVEGGLTGELPAKAMKFVTVAREQCDRLIRLVNDILDIKKIEVGKLELNLIDVEPGAIVAKCLESLQGMATEYAVKLSASTPSGGVINCDQDRIIQVLTNLISNAIKFSPSHAEVLVKLETVSNKFFKFSVSDRGPGIPNDKLHKLFGKFQQLDSSDTRAKGGTGLGLAISKAIVDQHGGTIGLESELGEGSTFWFELPQATASASEAKEISQHNSLMGKSALLVEDDNALAETLDVFLKSNGMHVVHAETLQQAQLSIKKSKPDIILLDIHLPDGKGTSLLSELRETPETVAIPVVIITGDQKDAVIYEQPCIIDWLQKPFKDNDVKRALELGLRGIKSHKAKVLVVEDDEATRTFLKQQLSSFDVDTVEAKDGDEALSALRHQELDLIILDVAIGHPDGFEVVEAIKQDNLCTKTPMIVYTSVDLTREDTKKLALGLTRHLIKSRATEAELTNTIKELLHGLIRE